MSTPIGSSVLDAETHALLQRIADDRERRCAALRAGADEQARQTLCSARAAARRSVSNAVAEVRARRELGIRQAKARAEIEARRLEQQKNRELLGQMWNAIGDVLERRWREPALRQAWIDAAMAQAAALLSGRKWLIESATQPAEHELDDLTNRARKRGAAAVEWSVIPTLQAGLRIRATSVCIDATVTGLLVQRAAIEAAFLAEDLPSLAASEPPTPGDASPKGRIPVAELRAHG